MCMLVQMNVSKYMGPEQPNNLHFQKDVNSGSLCISLSAGFLEDRQYPVTSIFRGWLAMAAPILFFLTYTIKKNMGSVYV